MNKSSNHLLNFTNNASRVLTFGILFVFIFNAFKSNNYEVLFIDERMLVDDIYNIWLFDDIFNRFRDISNIYLKNLFIFITETSYGGDLRYGRLWSNFFVFFAGPATFFGDTAVISFARILNISLFFFGNYLLVKYLVKKEFRWIALISIYSLPSVEYLHRFPKPDNFLILFVALGIKHIVEKDYYKAIFFLAVASFIKINTLILFAFLGLYILFEINEGKLKFIIKSSIISLIALLVVNPILIIPPIKIGSFNFPNFYKIYFQWLTSQGSNGENVSLNFSFPRIWIETLTKFYKLQTNLSFVFLFLFILLISIVIYQIVRNKDKLSGTLILVCLFYLLFYFLFIERQYTHYLHLPLTLLVLCFYKNLNFSSLKNYRIVLSIVLVFFISMGIFSNIERFNAEKTFNANYRYGYTNIDNENDAILLVNNILFEIRNIYSNNETLKKELVYWHPDLFVPRNGVTYNDSFFVREYWGSKDYPSDALSEADIFVTYTDYQLLDSIEKLKIENIYIYYNK